VIIRLRLSACFYHRVKGCWEKSERLKRS